MTFANCWLTTLVFGTAISASAEIRMPNVISDHAVLQRDRPIHIWGWASFGSKVTVSFHQQTAATVVDRLGAWSIWLHPETAGGPYSLMVKGEGTDGSKTISDLLIGDVWLASGQSNMEFPLSGFPPSAPLKNGPAEIAAANDPSSGCYWLVKRRVTFLLQTYRVPGVCALLQQRQSFLQ